MGSCIDSMSCFSNCCLPMIGPYSGCFLRLIAAMMPLSTCQTRILILVRAERVSKTYASTVFN